MRVSPCAVTNPLIGTDNRHRKLSEALTDILHLSWTGQQGLFSTSPAFVLILSIRSLNGPHQEHKANAGLLQFGWQRVWLEKGSWKQVSNNDLQLTHHLHFVRHTQQSCLCAGAGVEGTVHSLGQSRQLRFGSQDYASQGLSSSQQDALTHVCHQQGKDKVISVLVTSSRSRDPASTSDSRTNKLNDSPTTSQQSFAADSPTHSSSSLSSSQSDSSTSEQGRSNQIWVFAFQDTVHQRSAAALESLRKGSWLGRGNKEKRLRVMMLTGDNEASAERVAEQLQIEDVRAGLSPEQKLQVCAAALAYQSHLTRTAHDLQHVDMLSSGEGC